MTTLDDRVRALAADPIRGPELQQLLTTATTTLAERLVAHEFEPATPFTPDELVWRLEAYEALTAPLAAAWATLGWWSPSPSASLATALMGHLAAVRDRGSGVRPWLDLYAYPALLLFYAFGLRAMTARRSDNLALLLQQPLLDARKKLRPAVLELNHAAVVPHDVARSMAGMERMLTPMSDRLATITPPWITIPSDPMFEMEFDRFELLVGLVYYDLRRDEFGDWAPMGRFTWRGRYGEGVSVGPHSVCRKRLRRRCLWAAYRSGPTRHALGGEQLFRLDPPPAQLGSAAADRHLGRGRRDRK